MPNTGAIAIGTSSTSPTKIYDVEVDGPAVSGTPWPAGTIYADTSNSDTVYLVINGETLSGGGFDYSQNVQPGGATGIIRRSTSARGIRKVYAYSPSPGQYVYPLCRMGD
jgi:hypothetical protein